MTIEILKEFGAATEDGLSRCMNNEEFYLKMVNMGLQDERFETMKSVLEEKKLDEAFEMAHAMKGVFGNLALDPIYKPISEMTELLRAQTDMDYMPLYEEIKGQRDRLLSMDNSYTE